MPIDRHAEHEVDALFLERTSPRSFTGEAILDTVLFSMFEAARWAPSSSNVQPWRLIYGKRDTPQWRPIFGGLMAGNQVWAAQAAALVVFVSDIHLKRGAESVVSAWHSFDTGAAWMSLALQGKMLGWATHGMGGFVRERLQVDLQVPDDFFIDAVVAVGKQGPAEALPEALRAREVPTGRRGLAETVFAGVFGA